MGVLGDFLSPKAGQRRRKWLTDKEEQVGETLRYYLGPAYTPVSAMADVVAALSDGADFEDFWSASRALPKSRTWQEAVSNAGQLATAGAAMMVPGVSARMAEGAVDTMGDVLQFVRGEDGGALEGAIRAWHGTTDDAYERIIREGFDANYGPAYFNADESVALSFSPDGRTVEAMLPSEHVMIDLDLPGGPLSLEEASGYLQRGDLRTAEDFADAGYSLAIDPAFIEIMETTPAPAADRGAEILDLLKRGRGADVTDEMLDMGDPVLNARLNEYLFNNYDLPMDVGARVRRSEEIGHRLSPELYHGTDTDFQGFDITRSGEANHIPQSAEWVALADDPGLAGEFADLRAADNGGRQVVYPLVHRADAPVSGRLPPDATNESVDLTLSDAFLKGYDGVRLTDYTTPGGATGKNVYAIPSPTNIRSRFARFDPRLAHLRNLSAGVGGGLTLGAVLGTNNQAQAGE